MSRKLSILAPVRYPWLFNSPRSSRHTIERRLFVPLNKISSKIEGLTIFNPFPLRRFDLVHAFNRIPFGITPFIIGYESHLPRAFGIERTKLFEGMSLSLASARCKKIIAISEFAHKQFQRQHAGRVWEQDVLSKTVVRYPNLPIPADVEQVELVGGEPLRLIFVGNHFARKGGLVALRLAEMAQAKKLPLLVEIISSLEMGGVSWVDPLRDGFFDPYRRLMGELGTVRHYGSLPNAEVVRRMRAAHFSLLPTFSDTFGYSAIESMAHGTPVIATGQGALPEFIRDMDNGILLDIPLNDAGEWVHSGCNDRSQPAYEKIFEDEVQRLADMLLKRLEKILATPSLYNSLRAEAHRTAKSQFGADDANVYWDDLYERVVAP